MFVTVETRLQLSMKRVLSRAMGGRVDKKVLIKLSTLSLLTFSAVVCFARNFITRKYFLAPHSVALIDVAG